MIPGGVDAAIVDIGLPDGRGDDLIREIRAFHPKLPVVLVSRQQPTSLANFLQNDQQFTPLIKPYTESDLLAALQKVGCKGALRSD